MLELYPMDLIVLNKVFCTVMLYKTNLLVNMKCNRDILSTRMYFHISQNISSSLWTTGMMVFSE